jgi:prophage regulatory protein
VPYDQPNEPCSHPNGKVESMLRLKAVMDRTGLSRPSIYRLQISGVMPRSYSLTGRVGGAVAWKSSEIDAFIASRQHSSDFREG